MSEEIQKTYHAVERNGVVTAIWEMIGKKHLRTIDPRSQEGKALLNNYTPGGATQSEVAEKQAEV